MDHIDLSQNPDAIRQMIRDLEMEKESAQDGMVAFVSMLVTLFLVHDVITETGELAKVWWIMVISGASTVYYSWRYCQNCRTDVVLDKLRWMDRLRQMPVD